MRFAAALLPMALFCGSALGARADDVTNFSITGSEGTFSFSISGSSSPAEITKNSDQFSLDSAIYNGQTVASDTVAFYTAASGGGFYLEAIGDSFFLDEFGPQIFTGALENPIFTNGEFTLVNGTSFVDGTHASAAGDLLAISSGSQVPEPSTLALFGTGIVGLASFARRLLPRS